MSELEVCLLLGIPVFPVLIMFLIFGGTALLGGSLPHGVQVKPSFLVFLVQQVRKDEEMRREVVSLVSAVVSTIALWWGLAPLRVMNPLLGARDAYVPLLAGTVPVLWIIYKIIWVTVDYVAEKFLKRFSD